MATDTYQSAASKARKLLNAAGYSQRQVSARQDDSTLRVTIRDGAISLGAIKAIVAPLYNVRRCEASGEILGGGNTYLDVKYTEEVIVPHLEAARLRLASVKPGYTVRIGFHVAHLSTGAAHWDDMVRTSTALESGLQVCAHGIDHGLRQIVVDNLSRGAYRGTPLADGDEEIEIEINAAA